MFGRDLAPDDGHGRIPDSRAKSTNSRERSESVCARTARATHGQEKRPMKSAWAGTLLTPM